MNRLASNKTTDSSFQTLIVDNFEKDGAICDSGSKEYDVEKTYAGGTGDRFNFKLYNDDVITYHGLLKVLTGERRANIRETIPVIDFANSENTSLLNRYTFKDSDETQIDPTSITVVDTPSELVEEPSSYEYVEEEDESLINRAVMGQSPQDQFFSSKGTPQEFNIQASEASGEFSYIYHSIKLPTVQTNNVIYSGSRADAIHCCHITDVAGGWIVFTPEALGSYNPESEEDLVDDYGIKMPTKNTVVNDINIISKYTQGSSDSADQYQLELALDDIFIIIPKSTYAQGTTRILVFKNIQSNTEGEPGYEPYILYVDEANPTTEVVSLDSEASMPNYLNRDLFASYYSFYLNIEKEYYGPASGLMNGYFCSPKEYEGDIITKWKFENDKEYAATKNVDIPIGTKYFEGHILNRGLILDQPLGLTKSDPTVADEDSGHEGEVYRGKATIIYDKVRKSTSNLFKAIQVDKSDWYNFNLKPITAVISKADYSGESLGAALYKDLFGVERSDTGENNGLLSSKMKYVNKLKTSTGQILSAEDIRNYISKCIKCLSNDSTVLTLDTVNNMDNICYYYNIVRNSTALNWGWFTKTYTGGGEGNVIYENLDKIYYASWTQREKYKGKSIIDGAKNLSVQVASPINVFSKSNTSNDTLLIYPEYNKYIPSQLILLSKYDLGLEEFSPIIPGTTHTSSRGMCSFYNPVAKKIISFKVSEVAKFLPSKVNTVKLYSPGTRSWYTRSCKISGGTSNDCYIYILSPMELSLTGVTLYNENDEEVDVSSGAVDLTVMPLSYPKDYFSCTSKILPDGTVRFTVDMSHRATDLQYLNNSYIIPGLPEYENPEELRNIEKDGLKLDILADLMSDGVESFSNTITKKTIYNILSDWKLSDDPVNPIKVSNLSDVLDGLIELKYHLNDFLQSNITIPLPDESGYKNLTIDDVNPLLNHIDSDSTDYHYYFTLNYPENGFTPGNNGALDVTLKDRLSQLSISQKSQNIERASIKRFKSLFDGIFSATAIVDRQLCEDLDACLGNDTRAFLEFGDSASSGNTPTAVSIVAESLYDKIVKIILDTDKEYKVKSRLEEYVEALAKYFTSDSIEKALASNTSLSSSSSNSSFVNFNLLKFDYERYYNFLEGKTNTVTGVLKNPLGDIEITPEAESNFADVSYITSLLSMVKNKYATWGGFTSGKAWIFTVYYWVSNYWSKYSLSEFTYNYRIGRTAGNYNLIQLISQDYQRKIYIESITKQLTTSDAQTWINTINSKYSTDSAFLTQDQIDEYLADENNLRTESTTQDGFETTTLYLDIPTYQGGEPTNTIVPSGNIQSYSIGPYQLERADVSQDVLKGIADYVSYKLKGVDGESYSVKFLAGDEEPSGREDSLYFKRYRALNNRIHWVNGPLMQAASFLKNKKIFKGLDLYSENFIKSYAEQLTVVPLPKIETLAYFPTQTATGTTVAMPGKFYYEKELEALREEIGDKCILTCNQCSIKDSCPFYNEEEILKLYCTAASTLDVWVKDNMLDLIYYQEGDNPSPNLTYTSSDGLETKTISANVFKNIHKPYADIKNVTTSDSNVEYNINSLETIRERAKKYIPNWEDETRGGFGWLINGRYGSVQVNRLPSKAPTTFKGKNIPNYKLLYDAVFIPDEETEVLYMPSKEVYNVTLLKGEKGAKELYKGTTRIKIPATLKALAEAGPNDDVYLVSDDMLDESGDPMMPVIYLNKVAKLSYAFDLQDTGNESEVKSELDSNIYAKDIAQWCINYAKGDCFDDPLDPASNSDNQDQYWMNIIKKLVYDDQSNKSWIEVPGRPRVEAGFTDVVTSESTWDNALMVSGKPVAAVYYNFIRCLHINMNSILWVKQNSELVGNQHQSEELNYVDAVEKQRIAFTQMKTNLRLVIVHNN